MAQGWGLGALINLDHYGHYIQWHCHSDQRGESHRDRPHGRDVRRGTLRALPGPS